jgi:glutamate-5-semialdehyde dehydrogenase
VVAALDGATRARVLEDVARGIEAGVAGILEVNARDVEAAREAGLDAAKIARLGLTERGLAQVCAGVRQIAAMADPVGEVTREWLTQNGLKVRKVRTPLGVIAMIYEARPGVTIDAFALCFKAGNACVLKGGREATRSNVALARVAHEALTRHGVDAGALTLIASSDREELRTLLGLSEEIDLVIPRGGEALIRFVREHARMATIQHYRGVCHVYVDAAADVGMAVEIVATGKASAPATCNATECVLVHEGVAGEFVPRLVERAKRDGVTIRGDARVVDLCAGVDGAGECVEEATEADFGREFLDLVLAARVVGSMEEALAHIARYTSDHTEAIVTADARAAAEFVARVRSSCALVNASTRFNDGFSLGLGAEIGISTSRVHAYGPMGLEGLTIERYVVEGTGQTR